MVCTNCNSDIKIDTGKPIICPNCGKLPYICWNCNQHIEGVAKDCNVCPSSYLICDKCGVCHPDCKISEYLNFLRKELPHVNKDDIRKIVDFVHMDKKGRVEKICHNGVNVSYAKNNNSRIYRYIEGKHSKDDNDKNEFVKKFNKIRDMKIGDHISIRQVRQDGTYGHEERDCFNLAICYGLIRKVKHDGKKYSYYVWKRVEEQPCEYAVFDKCLKKGVHFCKLSRAKFTDKSGLDEREGKETVREKEESKKEVL